MTVVAYCENSVQCVPLDGFFGIQVVLPGFALDPSRGAYDVPHTL